MIKSNFQTMQSIIVVVNIDFWHLITIFVYSSTNLAFNHFVGAIDYIISHKKIRI